MKATGIVRRIDDLGRVVIPKEIRRTMRIREGDPSLTTLTSWQDFCFAMMDLTKRMNWKQYIIHNAQIPAVSIRKGSKILHKPAGKPVVSRFSGGFSISSTKVTFSVKVRMFRALSADYPKNYAIHKETQCQGEYSTSIVILMLNLISKRESHECSFAAISHQESSALHMAWHTLSMHH